MGHLCWVSSPSARCPVSLVKGLASNAQVVSCQSSIASSQSPCCREVLGKASFVGSCRPLPMLPLAQFCSVSLQWFDSYAHVTHTPLFPVSTPSSCCRRSIPQARPLSPTWIGPIWNNGFHEQKISRVASLSRQAS